MLTEAYISNDDLAEYYGEVGVHGIGTVAQMPLNFGLISVLQKDCVPKTIAANIQDYLEAIGPAWPNFNMGNHDQKRIGTRLGQQVLCTVVCPIIQQQYWFLLWLIKEETKNWGLDF